MTSGRGPHDAGAVRLDLPGGADQERLRAAVAANRSWRGVLRTFGITAPRHGRTLREACDAWQIDYSHFGSRGWTDEQLCGAVARADSWHELMRSLGYPADSGSARATVRKHAGRLRLDLSGLAGRPSPGQEDPFRGPPEARHLREAGAYLVAAACALRGHRVSWPLEPARYDLLVDTGRIQRVQVKTTTWRSDGDWACGITRVGSGQKAWYTAEEIDYFGVVDGDLAVYLIPAAVVDGLGTISVRRYDAYRLSAPGPEGLTAARPLG